MVVTRLRGGLGNQMFQYACGLAVANHLKQQLYIDRFEVDRDPRHGGYTLAEYQVPSVSGSYESSYSFKIKHKLLRRMKIFSRLESIFYFEPTFSYAPLPYDRFGDNVYLDGYWQSESYFNDIRDLLIAEFSPSYCISGKSSQLLDQIRSTTSVSIHIRRGDYLSNKSANILHGVLSLDYYNAAIDYIKQHVSEPTFYIFSDDPEWVNSQFPLADAVVASNSDKTNQKHSLDMYLMSACQHNIIANSSYSWWGAWLNQNPAKKVLAPKKWFNTSTVSSQSLVPAQWIRL